MTATDYLFVQHAERWSKYGDRFPLRVAEAYAGDLARAMTASDEEVLATVAAGETAPGGVDPVDWRARPNF